MANISEIPVVLSPIQAPEAPTNYSTLFHVAANYLGDAVMWDRVLVLNPGLINADGFWEYDLSTTPTVKVPPYGSVASDGGILQSFPVPRVPFVSSFNNDFNFRFI